MEPAPATERGCIVPEDDDLRPLASVTPPAWFDAAVVEPFGPAAHTGAVRS